MQKTIKIFEKKGCKIIAHRGLSGLECENTCAAFVAAGVSSYYGIETDVHVTYDKKFIICHDDNIVRLTGRDMVIEKRTLDELRKVGLSDTDGKNRSDLIFPIPEDYFSICRKYGKKAVFELKNKMENSDIDRILKLVKNENMFGETIFISFCRENLIHIREVEKNANIQYLTDKANDETLDFINEYNCGLDIYHKALTKDYVKKVHGLYLKVNAWTVNNPDDAENLIDMGVDYITTDILE